MENDSFRFLDSWTRLLPRRGGAVVALVGSGGCTTLLLRMLDVLVHEASVPRVLVTQTTAHPLPLGHREAWSSIEEAMRIGEQVWEERAVAWVTGERIDPVNERLAGVSPRACADLVSCVRPDVVLVQAHASCGTPLRCDGVEPVWPLRTDLACLVAPLAVVGRPWDERTVAGAESRSGIDVEPRRVRTEDVLAQVVALLGSVPAGVRPLPFFTGFGSYRDLDGMFALVQRLWDPPRLPVVCLGELLGDQRRDAADRAGLGEIAPMPVLDGERVYAVYPAHLDGGEEG